MASCCPQQETVNGERETPVGGPANNSARNLRISANKGFPGIQFRSTASDGKSELHPGHPLIPPNPGSDNVAMPLMAVDCTRNLKIERMRRQKSTHNTGVTHNRTTGKSMPLPYSSRSFSISRVTYSIMVISRSMILRLARLASGLGR